MGGELRSDEFNEVVIRSIVMEEEGIGKKVVVNPNWLPHILPTLVGVCINFLPYILIVNEILE
jgi:hypothetical protein